MNEPEEREELAVISGGEFGVRDVGHCVLWFGVSMLSGGALIVLSVSDAVALLDKHQVRSIRDLDGMPCTVRTQGLGGTIKFVDLRPRKP